MGRKVNRVSLRMSPRRPGPPKKPGLRPRCGAGVNPSRLPPSPAILPPDPTPERNTSVTSTPQRPLAELPRPSRAQAPLRTASMFTAVKGKEARAQAVRTNPENRAAGPPAGGRSAGTWLHTPAQPSPAAVHRREAGSAWGWGGRVCAAGGACSLARGDSGTPYGGPHSKSPTVPSMTCEPDLKPDAKKRNERLQGGAQAPSPSWPAAEPCTCWPGVPGAPAGEPCANTPAPRGFLASRRQGRCS